MAFEQGPKQMSYMPSGWIICDQTVGGCIVVGLRTMAVVKTALGPFEAQLKAIAANPTPEYNGFQQTGTDFMELIRTGIVPQAGP